MVNTGVETRVESSVESSVESRVESKVESSVESRGKRPAKKLSSAEKIVAYLVSNPTASAHELSIAVNLTVKGIEKNLKALRESGRLRHVGPTKGGHWEVRE
jgi:ATP-dependent DNA helicase RecG